MTATGHPLPRVAGVIAEPGRRGLRHAGRMSAIAPVPGPPLVLTPQRADTAVRILDEALASLARS